MPKTPQMWSGPFTLYIVYGEPIVLKKNIEGAPRIQYSSSYENDTYFTLLYTQDCFLKINCGHLGSRTFKLKQIQPESPLR